MEVWTTENNDQSRTPDEYYWDVSEPRDSTLLRAPVESPYTDMARQHAQTNNSVVDEHGDVENVHDIRDIFIDDASSYWKRSVISFVLSSVTFVAAVVSFLMFIPAASMTYFQLGGVLGALFIVFRIGGVYYLYVDVSYVKRVTVDFHKHVDRRFVGGWRPSTFFWVAATLFAPPFGEYAALTVYLFRRHRRTGVP